MGTRALVFDLVELLQPVVPTIGSVITEAGLDHGV